MFEQQHILKKIEQWADRLPYQSLKIEVELSNQTLTLEKTRQRPKRERMVIEYAFVY